MGGLLSVVQMILDAIGTFQTAKDVFRHRGRSIKIIGNILTSRWLSPTLCIFSIAALYCIEFGIPSAIWDRELRVSIPSYTFNPDTGKLVSEVYFVNHGNARRTVMAVHFWVRSKNAASDQRQWLDNPRERYTGGKSFYVAPNEPITQSFEQQIDPALLRVEGNTFGLEFYTLDGKGHPNYTNIDVLAIVHAGTFGMAQLRVEHVSLDKPWDKKAGSKWKKPALAVMIAIMLTAVIWMIIRKYRRNGVRTRLAMDLLPVSEPARTVPFHEERVGFLQYDKLEYNSSSFVAGEPFGVTVWFKNRGSFPVYDAQGFALLIYGPPAMESDAIRLTREAINRQRRPDDGNQVAVDSSIYYPTRVTMTQEQINSVLSGRDRIYLVTFADWKTADDTPVTPGWEQCSWMEPPESDHFNPVNIKWRICSKAPRYDLNVSFEKSDNLTVRVVNRNPDKPARLRRMIVYGVKDGKNELLLSTDSIGTKKAKEFPCILEPTEGRSFETLIFVPNSEVYRNTAYIAEIELETGDKIRSDVAPWRELAKTIRPLL
jgi:hypothetical protein